MPSWRRPGSFRSRQAANASNGTPANHAAPLKLELSRTASQPLPPPTAAATVVSSVNLPSSHSSSSLLSPNASSPAASTNAPLAAEADVTLRRAHSFESDER